MTESRTTGTVGGRPAAWLESGVGPALVLIHGAAGAADHWGPQLASLAPAARVIAPDLPGHGPLGGAGGPHIGAYADWVVALLDALGLETVVLGGHSMGGAIALTVALDHPGRLRGLVLVGTGARLRVLDRILELLRGAPADARTLIQGLSYAATTPAARVLAAERSLRETPALVTLGDYLACDGFDVRGRLAAIRAPALVVVGAEDRLTPPKFAQFLADTIPEARLVEVPGAGHFPQLEQPEAVNGAVHTFLARLPAPVT